MHVIFILSQLVDVGTPSRKQFLYILYAILCNFTCVFVQLGTWEINDDKTENIEKIDIQLDLEVTLHAQIFNC